MAHPKAVTGWRHDDPKVQREFERVGRFLADDDRILNAIAGVLGSTPQDIAVSDPKDIALWALTIFIDGNHLTNKKIVQGVNFESYKAKSSDPDSPLAYLPIKWFGENKPLAKQYRTINEAERSDLEAWASIPFADLTEIQGPMSVSVFRDVINLKQFGMKGQSLMNTVQLVNDEIEPEDNYYYGTGPNGNKGWWPISNAAGRLEVDFTWEDLTSGGSKEIGTIPADKRVFKTSVLVDTAFDADVTMTVGDDVGNGRLAVEKNIELSVEKSYDVELEYLYEDSTLLKLYQASNVPTVGEGTVIIYYM